MAMRCDDVEPLIWGAPFHDACCAIMDQMEALQSLDRSVERSERKPKDTNVIWDQVKARESLERVSRLHPLLLWSRVTARIRLLLHVSVDVGAEASCPSGPLLSQGGP